jgi:hypothetical protein
MRRPSQGFGPSAEALGGAPVAALPTLDEISANPERVVGLAFEALAGFERMAERVSFACRLEMLRQMAQHKGLVEYPTAGGDRLLTGREAAKTLGLAYSSLLRRRTQVPYRDLLVPVAGTRNLRFSAVRIEQYLRDAVAHSAGPRRTGV